MFTPAPDFPASVLPVLFFIFLAGFLSSECSDLSKVLLRHRS